VRLTRDANQESPREGAGRAAASAESALIEAGTEMLVPARALLARLALPLLTVWRAHNEAADVVRLSVWTNMLTPGEEVDRGWNSDWPELGAIRAAGAEALRQISCRWPPYALPPVIGLVTDGTGLAASGEHPSGLSQQWLLDHIGRGSPASIILPFDTNGVWALISGGGNGGLPARRN
jgi:hypothetical protein